MRSVYCLGILFGVGCGANVPPVACATDVDCAAAPMKPVCDGQLRTCAAGTPRAGLIGSGDGTPESITLTTVLTPDKAPAPSGMAFNPNGPDER